MDSFKTTTSKVFSTVTVRGKAVLLTCQVCPRTNINGYKVSRSKHDNLLRCHACRIYLRRHKAERPSHYWENISLKRMRPTDAQRQEAKEAKIRTCLEKFAAHAYRTAAPKNSRDASSQTGEVDMDAEGATDTEVTVVATTHVRRKQQHPIKIKIKRTFCVENFSE